jgi:hypothetical protein
VLLCLLVINISVIDLFSVCMKNRRNCWLQYFLYNISHLILQFEIEQWELNFIARIVKEAASGVEERFDLFSVFHLNVVREACVIVFCTVVAIWQSTKAEHWSTGKPVNWKDRKWNISVKQRNLHLLEKLKINKN